jgi:hypothetical protein
MIRCSTTDKPVRRSESISRPLTLSWLQLLVKTTEGYVSADAEIKNLSHELSLAYVFEKVGLRIYPASRGILRRSSLRRS